MGFDSGDGDKRPFHEVTINYRFDMSATEVTDQQFRASIDATGYETDARRCGGAMHCTSLFNRNILLERISYYYRMETLL
jgi:formylglycine-generating enzyme required for sulfatase activity